MPTYQRQTKYNEIWTREDDIRLNYFMRLTDASIRQVAEQMGRTPMSILFRARKAAGIDPSYEDDKGIAYKNLMRWQEYEDKYLIEQFNAGQSINALAKHFDRTPRAIVERLYKVLTDSSILDKTYQKIRKLRKLNS